MIRTVLAGIAIGISLFLSVIASVVSWTEHERLADQQQQLRSQRATIVGLADVAAASSTLFDQLFKSQQTTNRAISKMLQPAPRSLARVYSP